MSKNTARVVDVSSQVNNGRRGKIVKDMVELIKKYELSYDEFVECSKLARQQMELTRPGRKTTPKLIPTKDEVKRFMAAVEKASPMHSLMMRLLIYMGIRSCELVRIRIEDITLEPGEERLVCRRKAGRDKIFVLPEKITSLLRMYVGSLKDPVYLFEASFHKAYTERGIRKIVQRYREQAGVSEAVHAHNFRHLLLSELAVAGWTSHELQLISGHDSVTSLDTYVNKNSDTIRIKYNQALNQVGV